MVRPEPGDPVRIGAYTVLGQLGAGAMGQVFLASSPGGRLVAVKTIHPELAASHSFRARFEHEFAAAQRVNGIYTAGVVDAGLDAPIPWLATAYVAAPALDTVVKRCGPLSADGVGWLAAGCAEALHAIHRTGLVHRDIKPSNILLAADGIRIIDFGLAWATELPRLTYPGLVVGTASYMAPEQAAGRWPVGPAADVFALGATLQFAATGRAPQPAWNHELPGQSPGAPDAIPGGLPVEIRDIIGPCLHPDPRMRPSAQDILSLASDLVAHDSRCPPLSAAAWRMIDDYSLGPDRPRIEAVEPTAADASTAATASATRTSHQRASSPGRGLMVTIAAAALATGIGAGWLASDSQEHALQRPGSGAPPGGPGPGDQDDYHSPGMPPPPADEAATGSHR